MPVRPRTPGGIRLIDEVEFTADHRGSDVPEAATPAPTTAFDGLRNMTALGAISPTDQPRCRYNVDFSAARLHVYARSLATILRVDGEIDASNADSIAHEIRRFRRLKTPLILDLSHLDFLSVDGFRALLVLNHEHHKAGVHCSVITGSAMRPLLRIVINHGLPVVDSVAEALQLIEDVISSRRQFLATLARQREPQRRMPLAQLSLRPDAGGYRLATGTATSLRRKHVTVHGGS